MMIKNGKTYKIKGESKYFLTKYGTSNPEIIIEEKLDFHSEFKPTSFLYLGRALAEGVPVNGDTYYGHVKGLGEFVHESELEEV